MAKPNGLPSGLFYRQGSRIIWMDYRDENGKRVRASTHTSSIIEAKKCLKQTQQKQKANRAKYSSQKISFDTVAEHFLHKYSVLKKSHKTDQEIFQRVRIYFSNIDMACIQLETSNSLSSHVALRALQTRRFSVS